MSLLIKLLAVGVLSLIPTAWLFTPSAAVGHDSGYLQPGVKMMRTVDSDVQAPASGDPRDSGGVPHGDKSASTATKTKSQDFQTLCMAHCKGPLFRCQRFCAFVDK